MEARGLSRATPSSWLGGSCLEGGGRGGREVGLGEERGSVFGVLGFELSVWERRLQRLEWTDKFGSGAQEDPTQQVGGWRLRLAQETHRGRGNAFLSLLSQSHVHFS